jgi:hypothetical protein
MVRDSDTNGVRLVVSLQLKDSDCTPAENIVQSSPGLNVEVCTKVIEIPKHLVLNNDP